MFNQKKKSQKIAVITVLAILTLSIIPFASADSTNLPPTSITVSVSFNYPNWWGSFYIAPVGLSSGYDVTNTPYVAHCVEEPTNIYAQQYSATLFSSYDPANPYNTRSNGTTITQQDWNKVNYILNNKQGTAEDVQRAIWYFVDGGAYPASAAGRATVDAANANGANFVPDQGQILAIIVWFGSTIQTCIIEVPVPPDFVVPEYPLAALVPLVACFVAFAAYKKNTIKIKA